jgi:phytoene dehydrogenase-like protein
MKRKYRVVVIGGGITGLATAVAYAKHADISRAPMLLLEKEAKVGGMVTSFRRNGFLFDTTQLISDGEHLLDYYGIELDLRRFDGYYARIFLADPGSDRSVKIEIPAGIENFKSMLQARYPHQSREIARLLGYSAAMYEEIRYIHLKPSLFEKLVMAMRCMRTLSNTNRTFAAYLDKFRITDPELREVFDVFASFSGLPCERVAALMVVAAMISTLKGSFRPKQGFIKLPHKMRRRAESLGVEIQTKKAVRRILHHKGKVTGVALEDGETIGADVVVSTADTKLTLYELVGRSDLFALDPEYVARVDAIRMSPSAVQISLGLSDELDLLGLGMDCGYNVITTGRGAFEAHFAAFDDGKAGVSDDCFHIAVICPSLTTGSKPTLVIRVVPMPLGDWAVLRETNPEAYAAKKEATANFFIEKVERYLIPDLRKHIEIMDIASPATFARYSGSPTGANHDMSPYPDNFGRNRLPMETPVEGLFLPKFAHGILSGLQCGLGAADRILGGTILNGRYSL